MAKNRKPRMTPGAQNGTGVFQGLGPLVSHPPRNVPPSQQQHGQLQQHYASFPGWGPQPMPHGAMPGMMIPTPYGEHMDPHAAYGRPMGPMPGPFPSGPMAPFPGPMPPYMHPHPMYPPPMGMDPNQQGPPMHLGPAPMHGYWISHPGPPQMAHPVRPAPEVVLVHPTHAQKYKLVSIRTNKAFQPKEEERASLHMPPYQGPMTSWFPPAG